MILILRANCKSQTRLQYFEKLLESLHLHPKCTAEVSVAQLSIDLRDGLAYPWYSGTIQSAARSLLCLLSKYCNARHLMCLFVYHDKLR